MDTACLQNNISPIFDKTRVNRYANFGTRYYLFACLILLILSPALLHAQHTQPHTVSLSIYPLQGLRFGAFFQSKTGGSIIIDPRGERSASGSIILAEMGFTYGPASFGIVAAPGTMINILNGPDTRLTGSNGGTITLHLGNAYPASPFVTSAPPPSYNNVDIGGTLIVGSAVSTPAGAYSGSIFITFVQE